MMRKHLREAWPRTELHGAGVKHGDVGRAPCVKAGVQSTNYENANGVRPMVLNIRQPDLLGRNVGGNHRENSYNYQESKADRPR